MAAAGWTARRIQPIGSRISEPRRPSPRARSTDRVFATVALTVALVVASAFIHYEALRWCNDHLSRVERVPPRAKVLLAMGAAFCSHLAQMAAFAAGYALLEWTGHGSLLGNLGGRWATFLYFSAETYTSLGFGDVYPIGAMRLVVGMEALTGLLMISWTASFSYLEMQRHWSSPRR
ncbi:MAG: two pore domain potassium channel family protein [Burkholderiales bacterium]|nr:two pore domain potassium channel family protein [Burkholderiales bacterium]